MANDEFEEILEVVLDYVEKHGLTDKARRYFLESLEPARVADKTCKSGVVSAFPLVPPSKS